VWGHLFLTTDLNRDFRLSADERVQAEQAWVLGSVSDEDRLRAVFYGGYVAYVWNKDLNTWQELEVDAR